MNGTVTISLKEFDTLRDSSQSAKQQKERVLLATKELEVFLSFVCTRQNIKPLLDEFNRQSQTSNIVLESGRAKITFSKYFCNNNNSQGKILIFFSIRQIIPINSRINLHFFETSKFGNYLILYENL